MQCTALGRTGSKASVAGLGCGGNSRIGLGTGKASRSRSIWCAPRATSASRPSTQRHFMAANRSSAAPSILVTARRSSSRPKHIHTGDRRGTGVLPAADVVASLDRSLRNLFTDYVDVFMLHGVAPAALDPARSNVASNLRPPLPEADRARLSELFGHLVGVGLDLPAYIKPRG